MEWCKVRDGLPEPNIPVLIAFIGYNTGVIHNDGIAAIDSSGVWRWWDSGRMEGIVVVEITHWISLPEIPKD